MTRFLTFTTFSIIALTANAQYPAGMSEADMQQMMQGAGAIASCMGNIDQTAMERLGKESEQVYAEVKALCDAGKRDEAQAKAMTFAREKADDPTMQAIVECSTPAQGMMPQMQSALTVEELQNRHVCDVP